MTTIRYEGLEMLKERKAATLSRHVEKFVKKHGFPHENLVIKIFEYPRIVLRPLHAVHAELHHHGIIIGNGLEANATLATEKALEEIRKHLENKITKDNAAEYVEAI